MNEHLCIAVGLKDRALADQRSTELASIHQVSVVADGELAVHAVHDDRLGVQELAFASRRITDVPDGKIPGEPGQRISVEGLVDVAHCLTVAYLHPI